MEPVGLFYRGKGEISLGGNVLPSQTSYAHISMREHPNIEVLRHLLMAPKNPGSNPGGGKNLIIQNCMFCSFEKKAPIRANLKKNIEVL